MKIKSLVVTGTESPVSQKTTNGRALESNEGVKDFDLVAAGVCPHCRSSLSKEKGGRGTGVTRICDKCGHRW